MAALDSILMDPHQKYDATRFSQPRHWYRPLPNSIPGLNFIKKFGQFFVRREEAYTFYSENPSFITPPGTASYSLRLFNGPSATPDSVSKSLPPRSGEMLAVLFQGNRMLAYARISLKSAECSETRVSIQLQPGQAHIYNFGVAARYNPKEILPFFLSAVARKLHLSDFSRVFIISNTRNNLLLFAIKKAGFIPSFYVTRYFLMGMESFRTVKRFFHKPGREVQKIVPQRLRETATAPEKTNGTVKSAV